jgi:hypothetical protein
MQGYSAGSGSFNVCGNGNFGVCTASPAYTLDVSGTGRYTGALISAAHTCTNLTATGTISLPASSVGVAAISGLASIATTGTVTLANIPSLPASQITSGSFSIGSFGAPISTTNCNISAGTGSVLGGIHSGTTPLVTGADVLVAANSSTTANTTKFAGLKFQGIDTVGNL